MMTLMFVCRGSSIFKAILNETQNSITWLKTLGTCCGSFLGAVVCTGFQLSSLAAASKRFS